MRITVLSATKEQAVSKAGKPYTYLELAFKGSDGKVQGRKVLPFGESKVVYEALGTATTGETFEINTVKNEGTGYWDWLGVTKAGVGENSTSVMKPTAASTGGKVTGSNYETPEERAKKQIYIVRQSSISAAIALAGHGAIPAQIETILKVAKQFEQYVFDTGVPAATQSIIDMSDDVPQ